MHQELIRELSVITEEEQRILDGRTEIDQEIYTEKKDMVIDSSKLLQRGSLFKYGPIRGSCISRNIRTTILK